MLEFNEVRGQALHFASLVIHFYQCPRFNQLTVWKEGIEQTNSQVANVKARKTPFLKRQKNYFEAIIEVIFFSHHPLYLWFYLSLFDLDLGLNGSERGGFSRPQRKKFINSL